MENFITSKTNKNIKYAKKILAMPKFRNQEGKFIIEGVRLCEEALKNSVDISAIFYTQKLRERFGSLIDNLVSKSEEHFVISHEISSFISDTDAPQGVFCICRKINKDSKDLKNIDKCVLLENIQNPSNLGSILRSCDALGLKIVVLSSNSCDLYSPKVLRGSMGAAFRLNLIETGDIVNFINDLKNFGFEVYAAVPNEDALKLGDIKFKNKSAIAFGNEGNGLTENVINACNFKMTIPMNNLSESLNVSVAAGISVWEMMNRGKV